MPPFKDNHAVNNEGPTLFHIKIAFTIKHQIANSRNEECAWWGWMNQVLRTIVSHNLKPRSVLLCSNNTKHIQYHLTQERYSSQFKIIYSNHSHESKIVEMKLACGKIYNFLKCFSIQFFRFFIYSAHKKWWDSQASAHVWFYCVSVVNQNVIFFILKCSFDISWECLLIRTPSMHE